MSFQTNGATLTVSNVAETTATLTVSDHTGQWWYKANAGPDTTCQGPVSGATQNLTGLTGNTTYTYSVYVASGCDHSKRLNTRRRCAPAS